MSFIYPRTITITRPKGQSGVGEQCDYAAGQETAETVIAKGVPASIQVRLASGRDPVGLPADGANQTWRILTPKRALKVGQVQNRDIATDDLGNRYQIVADYRNSLGCNFVANRLEP